MDVSSKTTRLSQGEADTAVVVLARAFHNDPPFVHFVPYATERARILHSFSAICPLREHLWRSARRP